MIADLKRLHQLGFALHWLKPRSKAPVASGWTTGPRQEWADFVGKLDPDFNVGTRLGEPARFKDGTYHAVIDCDVKSKEPKHLAEMSETLAQLFPKVNVKKAPWTRTGRGNGSGHLHVRTKRAPSPARLAQSPDIVEVLMPSTHPSKNDLNRLGAERVKLGYRARPAWEISFMGTGQQVVIPPSIHPDTGNPYSWSRPPKAPEDFPLVDPPKGITKEKSDTSPAEHFEFPTVDLSRLPQETLALIGDGEGCTDRSAALFRLAVELRNHGYTEAEMISVFTDEANYIGSAAYDHAQTKSRQRAARWVKDYVIRPAYEKASAEAVFATHALIGDAEDLSEEAALAQASEISASRPWTAKLEKTGKGFEAKTRGTLKNINLILKNEVGMDVFKRNEFSGTDVYGCEPPWNDSKIDQEVRDIDVTNIVHWLARNYGFEAAKDKIYQAIQQIASENAFHPVRDFLDGLEWDGKPRIDTWLKRYLGAKAPEPYLSAISRKTLCAMVARVYEPGKKYDQVLILEGLQGVGKSTAVQILGDPWYSDAHINIADKDSVVAMRSVWVMELGELSGMRKADVDQLKEFISRRKDRIRMPYGRLAEDFPRQCVFIGTTNSQEYLKDPSGNRRFWPVQVGRCNFEALKRDRDQLLAEAIFVYGLGEKLYLETEAMRLGAEDEQAQREIHDTWVDRLQTFMKEQEAKPEGERFDFTRFTTQQLFAFGGPFADWKENMMELKRASDTLRKLGFEKARSGNLKYWKRNDTPRGIK